MIIGFDLETVGSLEDPRGITCAVASRIGPTTGTQYAKIWTAAPLHPEHEERGFADCMTPDEVEKMMLTLLLYQDEGHKVVTWNGAGFDFRLMCQFGRSKTSLYKRLALHHVDLAFHMFCARGFMTSLDNACRSNGLKGKTEGIDGAAAVALWQKGYEGQSEVIRYCANDAAITGQLYDKVETQRYLKWRSKASGRLNFWWLQGPPLTVTQALSLPIPDTSWMKEPWSRGKFIKWALPWWQIKAGHGAEK